MLALNALNSSPSSAEYRYDSESATALEIPTRSSFMLFGELVRGCRFREPLPVCIEIDEDGMVLFSDDIFAMYGRGENAQEAIEDYVSALQEYHEILKRHAEADDASREAFERLCRYVSFAE